jgi:hypothetical protein
MISAWHLIWIVPLVAAFGFVLGAIMAVGKDGEKGDKP